VLRLLIFFEMKSQLVESWCSQVARTARRGDRWIRTDTRI